jgi:hypothetical protein
MLVGYDIAPFSPVLVRHCAIFASTGPSSSLTKYDNHRSIGKEVLRYYDTLFLFITEPFPLFFKSFCHRRCLCCQIIVTLRHCTIFASTGLSSSVTKFDNHRSVGKGKLHNLFTNIFFYFSAFFFYIFLPSTSCFCCQIYVTLRHCTIFASTGLSSSLTKFDNHRSVAKEILNDETLTRL